MFVFNKWFFKPLNLRKLSSYVAFSWYWLMVNVCCSGVKSYVLGEIPSLKDRITIVRQLWDLTRDVLVWFMAYGMFLVSSHPCIAQRFWWCYIIDNCFDLFFSFELFSTWWKFSPLIFYFYFCGIQLLGRFWLNPEHRMDLISYLRCDLIYYGQKKG